MPTVAETNSRSRRSTTRWCMTRYGQFATTLEKVLQRTIGIYSPRPCRLRYGNSSFGLSSSEVSSAPDTHLTERDTLAATDGSSVRTDTAEQVQNNAGATGFAYTAEERKAIDQANEAFAPVIEGPTSSKTSKPGCRPWSGVCEPFGNGRSKKRVPWITLTTNTTEGFAIF